MSLKFEIEQFDPRKEELQEIVESVKDITADPKTISKEELALVSSTRKTLMRKRTDIAKAGKAAREAANQYNKDVIAYEKELIGIIAPEEERLKKIETETKEYNIRQVRMEKLPEMKERLVAIDPRIVEEFPDLDDHLLGLDPNDFEAFVNDMRATKLENDRLALEEEKQKEEERLAAERQELEAEKQKIQHEKEVKEAADNARAEAEAEAKKKEEERLAAEKKAKEEEIAAQKKSEEERIEREKATEAKRAADEEYASWLKKIGYDPEKDRLLQEDGKTHVYRWIATYEHE